MTLGAVRLANLVEGAVSRVDLVILYRRLAIRMITTIIRLPIVTLACSRGSKTKMKKPKIFFDM